MANGKHPPEVVKRVRDRLKRGDKVEAIVKSMAVSRTFVKNQRAIIKAESSKQGE